MNNTLKIYKIKKIDNDINILNTIDCDIDILIIYKIDLQKFINTNYLYDDYIKNIFKNINLPPTLKHLIIKEFEINELFVDINDFFLTDIFNNLKLPLNCVIDAKFSYDKSNDPFNRGSVIFYSSLNKLEEEFIIRKNNFDLLNRNEKFYNEYYKYVEKK